MDATSTPIVKPYKGFPMEGILAAWYAKITGKTLGEFRGDASRVAAQLQAGDRVLEIAPGPGYLAIELAKLGRYRIMGLDISHAFVRIATENAARAGVSVDFRLGDAAALHLLLVQSISSFAARHSRTSAILLARFAKCTASCGPAGEP